MSAEKSDLVNNDHIAADAVESNLSKTEPENGVKADEVQSEPQQQQDEDDDTKKIFVGGLSRYISSDELKRYFQIFGTVSSATIKLDRSGNPRGFGFVTFKNEDSIAKVLKKSEHKMRNRTIDPQPVMTSRKWMKRIFVGGLSPDVPEAEIKKYFTKYGVVESVVFPYDIKKKQRKSYVFLSFTTEEAAKNALRKRKQDVCGSMCDVRMAVPKDQTLPNKVGAWNPYMGGTGTPDGDYFSYKYPYRSSFGAPIGFPYGHDLIHLYTGNYNSYPYGYGYPMPPQTYGVPGMMPKATGRNMYSQGSSTFHPYTKPK